MFDIKVQSITVKSFRIVCLVQFLGQTYSNAKIKEQLLNSVPSLYEHKCKNASSKQFSEVMDSTSLAHILEHLIIDFQIKHANEEKNFDKTLFGTSEWHNKQQGIAKIEFSFYDDKLALKSINEAVDLLKLAAGDN